MMTRIKAKQKALHHSTTKGGQHGKNSKNNKQQINLLPLLPFLLQ